MNQKRWGFIWRRERETLLIHSTNIDHVTLLQPISVLKSDWSDSSCKSALLLLGLCQCTLLLFPWWQLHLHLLNSDASDTLRLIKQMLTKHIIVYVVRLFVRKMSNNQLKFPEDRSQTLSRCWILSKVFRCLSWTRASVAGGLHHPSSLTPKRSYNADVHICRG